MRFLWLTSELLETEWLRLGITLNLMTLDGNQARRVEKDIAQGNALGRKSNSPAQRGNPVPTFAINDKREESTMKSRKVQSEFVRVEPEPHFLAGEVRGTLAEKGGRQVKLGAPPVNREAITGWFPGRAVLADGSEADLVARDTPIIEGTGSPSL